jgi:regulator of protease activity HflC (stomatin/prohibitin superfamily)
MPWLLTISVFFTLVATVFAIGRRNLPADDEGRAVAFGVTLVCGVLAFLMFAWSCLAIVSTRNVGIVTSFGKPVGTLSNGIHVKLPWQKVPELNGTIQTDSQIGGFDGGKCSGGTPVRLANNSTACVDNTVRWRISPSAGDALFRDYQNDANIRTSLVTRELSASLNEVFAAYNPLAPDAAGGPNLTDLSTKATEKLQQRTGGQIEVQNVIISIVHFDEQTQAKVNAYQSQVADTRIAEARQQTAAAEAEANRRLADSISRDPNVLVSKCLDMLNSGKPVPVGFQCWPGAGLPVTIPAR